MCVSVYCQHLWVGGDLPEAPGFLSASVLRKLRAAGVETAGSWSCGEDEPSLPSLSPRTEVDVSMETGRTFLTRFLRTKEGLGQI